MAKRKTIKNNPLDSLSSNSILETPAEFEKLLMGSGRSPKGATTHPTSKGKPRVYRDPKRNPPTVLADTLVVEKVLQSEKTKKESSMLSTQRIKQSPVEVSTDNLAQRLTRLEEDHRMQNIMIGIIMVPLAVLALLGAAPV